MSLLSAAGYKQHVIKEWFCRLLSCITSDVTFDYHERTEDSDGARPPLSEPWKVTLVDTGLDTMTGGQREAHSAVCGGRDVYADLRRRRV